MRYITDFQIRDGNGHIHNANVTNMQFLSNHILQYGTFDMQKVSFYIQDGTQEFRNVIIRNRNNVFVPEFCDEDVELQKEDWALVAEALQYGNLDEQFVKFIQLPW